MHLGLGLGLGVGRGSGGGSSGIRLLRFMFHTSGAGGVTFTGTGTSSWVYLLSTAGVGALPVDGDGASEFTMAFATAGAGLTTSDVEGDGTSTYTLVLADTGAGYLPITGTGTSEITEVLATDGAGVSTPETTGTGASTYTMALASTGAGVETFTGTGASTFTLALATSALGTETFTGTGASTFTLVLASTGAGAETFTGTGTSTWTLIPATTAGVGNVSTNPLEGLSGLTAWYKGDVGITQTSNQVSAWADQSASGYNLNSVSSTKPTYVASAQNSLPGVQFISSSSTRLSREANSPCFTTAFTIMCVVKVVGSATSWLMSHGVGNISGIGLEQDAAPHWRVQRQGTGSDADGTPDSSFHVITFRSPNASTYPDFRIDGVQQYAQGSGSWSQPDQSGAVPAWVAEIVLGAQDSVDAHTYSDFADCTWCELAIANRELNTTDLHAIEVALGAKWGISIT